MHFFAYSLLITAFFLVVVSKSITELALYASRARTDYTCGRGSRHNVKSAGASEQVIHNDK